LYFQGKYGKFVVLNHHLWFYKITLCYMTSFFLKDVAVEIGNENQTQTALPQEPCHSEPKKVLLAPE
jgi:hypothetical protein